MKRGIVVAGAIARKPTHGGHAWALLSWALGFRALGFEVTWIDRVDGGADADESARTVEKRERERAWFARAMAEFGLARDACLLAPISGVRDGAPSIYGLDRGAARERIRDAELLLNVMGYLDDEELFGAARRRVFLDIDPGFGQMWRALGLADLFAGHDDFATVGRNIGRAGCSIPDCGLDWIATRPPVALERWPERSVGAAQAAFRSVASWRGRYDPIEFDGRRYGVRAHGFRKLADLPNRTGEPFELALDIDPADEKDRARLVAGGWTLVDPKRVAADPWRYRRFVAGSAAELQVAKELYVESGSGWFSDRSACFLASGRPVIVEDTGLAGDLPLGEGLLAFRTLEEAAAAVAEVSADLPRHSRAARRIAEEHFAADRVARELLDDLGVAA